MKVLITGASGFLGSHLLRYLQDSGIDAQGWNTQPNEAYVDITNYESVKNALGKIQPDLIIHMAGLAFVLQKQPVEFYRTNIIGTENILNAVLELDTAKEGLVLASTAGVYGNQEAYLLSEQSPTLPVNHYSMSKLSMELTARKYQSDRSISIIRPFNIIGPSQSELFVTPKIVKHYAERAKVIELGNTTSVRDYLFIDDFNYLLTRLVTQPIGNNTINICTGVGHSVQDILNMLTEISGYQLPIKQTPQHIRKDDVHRMVGDTTFMSDLLAPQRAFTSLKDALAQLYSEKISEFNGQRN